MIGVVSGGCNHALPTGYNQQTIRVMEEFNRLMALSVRPAQADDIPLLADYWYDKMVLVQQFNPRVQLLPDAQVQWQQAAQRWLQDATLHFLVATPADDLSSNAVTGAMVGYAGANSPGLAPVTIGIIAQFVVDIHSPQVRQGIGRVLLQALRERFQADGITQIRVHTPPHLPVENAFWHAQGAILYDKQYTLTIDPN